MSDTPTTTSLIVLATDFRGDIVRQINRRTQLLKFVPIVTGEGKNCAWVPESDGAIAENHSEGADAANFGGDAQDSAILNWSLYRSNFHVTSLAMDTSATARTPEGNRLLWGRHIVNAAAKLASHINGQLFSGAGTGTLMCGLDEAIGKDDNTYATLDRVSKTFWKPTVVAPGSDTAVTFALIRDDIRKIYEACGENPDVAFCSPSLFNSVGALFDATRRQVINQVMSAKGPITLEFGFGALEVDGVVFMKDKDATAKTIYYLNTSAMRLEVLPAAENRPLLEALGDVSADDGFGLVPLGFTLEKLAKTGAADKAQMRWTGQLVVERPNAFGVRKNAV